MSLAYLVDTNILAEPLRPRPSKAILDRLRAHQHEIAVAAPVWHEMLFGYHRLAESTRKRALGDYLFGVVQSAFPILAYDEPAAAWHSAERARLAAIGKTPPFVDGQIASIARVRGLTLVSLNVSDFDGFEGIEVGDWS